MSLEGATLFVDDLTMPGVAARDPVRPPEHEVAISGPPSTLLCLPDPLLPGRVVLGQGATRLNVHLVRYPSTTLTYGDRWEAVLREHEELLGAIEARDGEAARRIAEHHMFGAREVRLRMYADSNEHTGTG